MRKLILSLGLFSFLVCMSGCQTVKNTSAGLGVAVCGFSKGLADDAYSAWKAVERADEWVKENYW